MLQTENNLNQSKLGLLYSKLTVHFQPIFSSKSGKIFGYESLTRHISMSLNIKDLFLEAKKNGSIFILDMICRRNAIKKASEQNINSYLFINICPETLFYPQHEIGINIEPFFFASRNIAS